MIFIEDFREEKKKKEKKREELDDSIRSESPQLVLVAHAPRHPSPTPLEN